ncbi:MAG: hypothetical protein Q8K77_04160 [Thermodesulfovibrionales bacterium]|nr:hypothetical protein [Thermodesulfovibrionales bacterium]
MGIDLSKDLQLASAACEEELKPLVYHKSSEVIAILINNKTLTEDLAAIIAGRKNIDSGILESLSHHVRWKDSYKVRLALCKNPKTPQKITFSLIKFLRVFDLAGLTRNNVLPVNVRVRIEGEINEKIPAMALGIKIALAKSASSNVLMKLIEEGLREVVAVCLDSPYMTEGDIYKIISMKKISLHIIRMIAEHPKWSARYQIRWALIINKDAPLACVVKFLEDMKTTDLKELYAAPDVPSSTKPYIYRELLEREEG